MLRGRGDEGYIWVVYLWMSLGAGLSLGDRGVPQC